MLSSRIQDPIYSIYGFVRLADEIVDSFHDFDKSTLLDEFELELKRAIERKISLNPILNSFQEVVHKYGIDQSFIDAFLKSMRTDLHKQQYKDNDEYKEYIYGSADVVGLMCLKIFVQGDNTKFNHLKPNAMRLGSAFQKVNFLRDLKDDSELLNRSYFPQFTHGEYGNESKTAIIEEIQEDLKEGYNGIKQLPIDARFGVYIAYVYYKKLLSKLNKSNIEEIKTKRIRLSNSLKIGLLAKSFIKYKLNML
jgi:phytoene/squalene synthetase